LIPSTLDKVKSLSEWLNAQGKGDIPIVVDGGITEHTSGAAAKAGARVLVAGTAVFGETDRARAIEAIREAAVRQAAVV
jgi:ribulose-phosphate 3-epimerase